MFARHEAGIVFNKYMEEGGNLYLSAQRAPSVAERGKRLMLIAFDSTQQALRAEMLLEYADIDIDIRPTPKEITAGCALSIEFPDEELERVRNIIVAERVEIRGFYRHIDGKYELYSEKEGDRPC